MFKFICAIFTIAVFCSGVLAQGRSERDARGQGNQSRNSISIPVSVLKASLPLDKTKLDLLESDAKFFQSANLPLEALIDLKLTNDQKKTISDLIDSMQVKMRELTRDGDRDGAMALREQFSSKVSSALTDEQKKVIEKYPVRNPGGGNRSGRGPGGSKQAPPTII